MARLSLADIADADLAERAAAGDNAAFEELYRRHAQAAWRVAQAVTNHRDDAADAVSDAFTRVLQALPQGRLRDGGSFRSYLLTATRRAGIDQLRRRARQQPGEVAERVAEPGASPTERLLQATDSALVTAAFRGLPERWRSVLWLTEVEQIPAKEAAPMLGLSPNGVAQLAVRARAGLRERYLQAHVAGGTVEPACRFTVDHLGAYVAGALAPRDLAKVDQHLAGCETCRARHAELEDLGGRLRRIVLPLPLGLGGLALKQWRFDGGLSFAGKLRKASTWAAKAERPAAVMSAALFAAGLAGVTIVGKNAPAGGRSDRSTIAIDEVQGQRAGNVLAAPAPAPNGSGGNGGPGGPGGPAEDVAGERRAAADEAALEASTQASDDGTGSGTGTGTGDNGNLADQGGGGQTTPPPPPPPPPPPGSPTAQFNVSVSGGGTVVAAAAGQGDNSCTGARVDSQSAGQCAPPPPNSDALITVSTGGSQVPAPQHVEVPSP